MATTQVFPVNGLKSAIAASRNDLVKLRKVNEELGKNITALSNKSQYNATFIATETAKLREEAKQVVTDYLTKENTYPRLQSIAAQAPHWTVRAFLSRAMVAPDPGLQMYDESGNTVKFMKAQFTALRMNNFLLSISMMDTETLAATADAAIGVTDWAIVGAVSNALGYRAEKGDDDARRARNRLDQTDIPEVTEARSLLDEAHYLERLLNNTMEAVVTGGDDIGIRVEKYAEMAAAQEQARNAA